MNPDLLKIAVEKLNPYTFFIRDSFIGTNESLTPSENTKEMIYQVAHGIKKIEHKSAAIKELEEIKYSYKIFYEFAVRAIFEEDQEEVVELGDAATLENKIQVFITTEFEATYLATDMVEEEAIAEFAKSNVPFNIWPFWREYVQSTCQRIGLTPTIAMPFYKQPNT